MFHVIAFGLDFVVAMQANQGMGIEHGSFHHMATGCVTGL
jgi:hypothetical protein